MQNQHNFAKTRNTKIVISVLSSDYYNENYHFNADFSTNAYVFVFSIIPYYIRISLFPSITPTLNAKILLETHKYFSQCLQIPIKISVTKRKKGFL